MKKLFASLTALMICGASISMAQTASSVRVTFDPTATDVKIGTVEVPEAKGIVKFKDFNVKEAKKPAEWYFVPVPVEVEAKSRGGKAASYIGELKLNIHAVFLVGKDNEPTMISKEVTYAEIPVSGGSDSKPASGKFNAGFFISPMNAYLICGKKPDNLQSRLAAIAVEATFDGSNCNSSEKAPAIVLDNSQKDILSGKWWTKTAANPLEIKLHSMAESPFAPFFAAIAPPTVPLYGSAAASGSSSSSSYTGDTDSGAATDYTADTTTTDTTDESTTKKSSKKKSKKKRK